MPGAEVIGESGEARIRVSEEAAATGQKSLRFTDMPGIEPSYNPHLILSPGLRTGTARASFSLRLDKGGPFYHEWRDSRNPYQVGPSLWFHPDGRLQAHGQDLGQIPLGEWVQVEITCALGSAATGAYELRLTLPDQPAQRFILNTGSPGFNRLDWFGFVGAGDADGVMFLDDLELGA